MSLYDHSRTTAALTACLAAQPDAEIGALLEGLSAWHRAGDESEPPAALTETDVALLVGGDISGVQSFIYTITARGATSALRGRSFYLQLLTEAVVRYILRELGLPMTNLIYQGGGRFYLLAPPDAALRLREIQRFISETLLKHHDGDLYLAVAWEALKAADFYGGRIAAAWDGVGAGLQRAKQRRFSELGEGLTALFAPRDHGGNEESQCQVCGREHTDIKVEADTRKCAACRAYEALGKDLRRARYLWLETLDPGAETPAGGWGRVLAELGLRAGVSEEIPGRAGGRRVLLALDDAAMAGLSPRPHTAVGRRFLVNVTPIIQDWEIADLRDRVDELPEPGSVKPFSALAAQAQGIDRLGVLRMDVDNLGVLFAEGFPKGTRSLSRLAALSFAVSLFFEGWVGALAETVSREARSDKRGDTLYAIYSGGDDLFFVGAWDVVVTLAQRIRADLGRFAAGHPAVHASAGIALIGGKYPLYQAAEDAGEAEGKAKSLVWTNADGHVRRKDAIAFLDVALPWPRFGYGGAGGDTVTGLQRTLVAHRDAGMPHSVLRTLLQLYADYRQAAEARAKRGEDRTRTGEPQALWGPWIWRGFYRLKREGKRYPEIEALAERLHDDWFQALPWAGVAARWAELL
ncbi:MAG: type III-A CRISPR-associated protein Cas10/Csm1, partial [Paracoccaceae bacterium]